MKIKNILVGVSVALLATVSADAQGTFQNLNFEQANPVIVLGSPYYPYAVTSASSLPYWTVSYGDVQQTQILYNAPSAGATQVMLTGPDHYPGFAPIDGNYSVVLQGGITASAASISQTGLIPAGTQSLLFEAEPPQGFVAGPLEVMVGAQRVPFTEVGTGPNYTLYGANISAWAGQTEQLTFSALQDSQVNNWIIDDISFSPTAVPEPSPLVLTGGGALVFALYRRFAPKSQSETQTLGD
jgi:hypothetical protein